MIRLHRSVEIQSFDAEATVAVGRSIPELLAVARLAAELARPLGAADVLRELLGNLPVVLGRRVIDRCVKLGILEYSGSDGDAVLSEEGRTALEQNEVLAPKEGIWRFFFLEDPLVPAALVHVMQLQPEEVRKERAAAKAHPQRHKVPTPRLLGVCEAAAPRLSIQNGHLFRLNRIAEYGERGPEARLTLSLTWGDSSPALTLKGQLPSEEDHGSPVDAGLPVPEVLASVSYEQLWSGLVTCATQIPGEVLTHWRAVAGKHVVPVSFSSLSDTKRRAFRCDLEVPEIHVDGLGTFEETTLRDVDLVPASERDAQEWLQWLQWEEINDYVTPAILEEQKGAQLARFPHHSPGALRPAELLERARVTRDERAWLVLGPADLGLWS